MSRANLKAADPATPLWLPITPVARGRCCGRFGRDSPRRLLDGVCGRLLVDFTEMKAGTPNRRGGLDAGRAPQFAFQRVWSGATHRER